MLAESHTTDNIPFRSEDQGGKPRPGAQNNSIDGFEPELTWEINRIQLEEKPGAI